MHDGAGRGFNHLGCAAMKPSLKRKGKAPAHELAPQDPFGPTEEKTSRFSRGKKAPKQPKPPKEPKQKKPKKEKQLTPQEEFAASAAAAKAAAEPSGEGAAAEAGDKPSGKLAGRLSAAGAPLKKLSGLSTKAKIASAVIAVVVLFGALQLRPDRDDDALVRTSLERYEKASAEKDYQTLCDELLASSYVKRAASTGLPCEVALRTALEDVRNPTLEVLSVEVNGDRAAARVRGSAAGQVPGEDVYTLVREDDSWRILPPQPAATGAAP
jgi:hypothetical protein